MKNTDQLPRHFTDEEKAKAKRALEQVDSVLHAIVEGKRQLKEATAAIVGAKPKENPRRSVWRGIVDYVNADPQKPDYKKFLALVNLCSESTHLSPSTIGELAEMFLDVKAPVGDLDPEKRFRLLCRLYQPKLRSVLKWLCAPDKHKDSSSEVLHFLGLYASGIQARREPNPEANFDEESQNYCPIFYWQEVRYRSLMSPLCKFILNGIEQYHKNMSVELPEAVPIGQCQRPGCERFFLPQRTGQKKFCSDKCCDVAQPRRTGKQNRDYMRLYRLERTALPTLRMKIRSNEKKEWLMQIEKDWPELSERVKSLRQRAAGK